MKKLREIFWKYFVEKPFTRRKMLEKIYGSKSMSWPVAPKTGDILGYKIFGIMNFLTLLIIAIFISSFVSLIFKNDFFLKLFKVFLGAGITLCVLQIIYNIRYKIWLGVGVNIFAASIFITFSYFVALKNIIINFFITMLLVILLFILLTITDGGKDEEKGD